MQEILWCTSYTIAPSKSERENVPKSTKEDLSSKERVPSNFSNGNHGSVLLMTCQVIIRGPNGSTTQERALLDSESEVSFITERLAQQLRLSRHQGPMISCIGETTPLIRPKGLMDIRITDSSFRPSPGVAKDYDNHSSSFSF